MPSLASELLYLPSARAAAPDAAWLTVGEQAELTLLTDAGRRAQWLAGRQAAKQIVIRSGLARRPGEVEIRTRDVLRRGSRPQIRIQGKPISAGLSIAHTSRGAIVMLSRADGTTVGVDLVDLADAGLPKLAGIGGHRSFARLWFTPLERFWIAADPVHRTATLWAVKEAIYKACHRGESWSPLDVTIWPQREGAQAASYRCHYRGQAIENLTVQIRQLDGHLAALAWHKQTNLVNSRETQLLLGQAS